MIQVSTQNCTGHRYVGHFDISLKNEIASLQQQTCHALTQSADIGYGKWVNGRDYMQTKEVFGILPFDKTVQEHGGMSPYSNIFVKDNPVCHQFLSQKQGTCFAVLPIHSHAECLLFQAYVESSPLFSDPEQPDFSALAQQMNEHADGRQIFYKVCSTLHSQQLMM